VFKDETKKIYHTVGTAPKYHTDILELFQQCDILELFQQCDILELFQQCDILELFQQCDILTAPKSNSKIVERGKINTLTHKYTWPLTFLALYILYKILPF
jgi:hypothetical protein